MQYHGCYCTVFSNYKILINEYVPLNFVNMPIMHI